MAIMDRQIEHVRPGKVEAYLALAKKYDELNASYGAPHWQIFRMWSGGQDTLTFVIERQWESMEAQSAVFTKVFSDPQHRHEALDKELEDILVGGTVQELYWVVS
jgi:hypothetical protein